MRLAAFVGYLVLSLPTGVYATCSPMGGLTHYNGTIGDRDVRVTLELGTPDVHGTYFYLDQLKEIALHGTLSNESSLTLDVSQSQSEPTGHFEGKFPESDPDFKSAASLGCDVIRGYLRENASDHKLPVKLRMSDNISGDLNHRYSQAGATDDSSVERNALRFWNALKQSDRHTVALLINYPINIHRTRVTITVRDPQELLLHYDRIFNSAFRAAILHSPIQ